MIVETTSIEGLGGVSLEAYFQRKVSLRNRSEVVAYEALLRGRIKDRSIISPHSVFSLIERRAESGGGEFRRQVAITMLRKATRAVKVLRAGISINIDANMLADTVFLSAVLETPRPEYPITIEIIETPTRLGFSFMAEVVAMIREAGYRVALDDFGASDSNLLRLARLPVDEVKIDAALLDFRRGQTLLPHIVRCIHELEAEACIEGIETEAHHDIAVAAGADTAQGFLYGPPGPIKGL